MGIAAVPEAELFDREHRRAQVALGLREMLGLHQQDDVDVERRTSSIGRPSRSATRARLGLGHLARGVEATTHFDERAGRRPRRSRARSPARARRSSCRCRGRVRETRTPVAPSTYVRGHGHRHAVVAEVGVELRVGVELMAVPAAGRAAAPARRLVDPELGEPLADQRVVADVAGAREDARQLRREGDVEGDALARARPARGSATRATVRSSALPSSGASKRKRAREVGAVGERQRGDVDEAPAVLLDRRSRGARRPIPSRRSSACC